MRRWITRLVRTLLTLLAALVALLVGVVGRVEASDGMRGNKCIVAAHETITEDFYFFCRTLDIYGVIDGDVIGLAVEVTIWPSAVVTGDLWIGGGKLDVAGTVGDDMHFGGVVVNLRPEAQFPDPRTDLASVALDTKLEEDVYLPGDLLVYGYQIKLAGTVGGDVDFSGEALILNGMVEGRVDASVGDPRRSNDLPSLPFWDVSFRNPGLWIGEDAQIRGDLAYSAASASLIPSGTVGGRLEFALSDQPLDITKAGQPNEAAQILVDYIRRSIRNVLTLMIIGVIVLRLMPRAIRQPAAHVRQHVISAVGWGLVTFMLSVPVAIVIVIIGLILLLILYFVKLTGLMILVTVGLVVAGSGLIGGFYFLLFFMGRIVVSFLIGQMLHRYVLHLPEWGQMRQWVFTLAMGTVVFTLISNMPVPAVGLIFELVTALAGSGAVIITLRDAISETGLFTQRVVPAPVLALDTAPATPTPAPVPPAPKPLPPGLVDLPEGFTGFDEDW